MKVLSGVISRWSTTALATVWGVRDRRNNETNHVDEALTMAHAPRAYLDGEAQGSEADDDEEFEEVQK